MSSVGKIWGAPAGAFASIQRKGPLGLLTAEDINTVLTRSKYPEVDRAVLIYRALGQPEVSYVNGVMKIGEFVINHNQFPAALPSHATVVETIPVDTQIEWYRATVGSAEQAMYFAHSERCDNRVFRPCAIICSAYSMPLAWEIAAFSRDPGNIGQLVAAFAAALSPDQLDAVARLAAAIAQKKPVCAKVDICMRAAGLDPEKSTDVDVICALVVAVGSYTGRFAQVYLAGCKESDDAIRVLEHACRPLLPLSLGFLSPHLSH